MAYSLIRLAPGSYDVLRDGELVAGLVRNGSNSDASWTAELLLNVPSEDRPAPFIRPEHVFRSLEEARAWLGGAEVLPSSDAAP